MTGGIKCQRDPGGLKGQGGGGMTHASLEIPSVSVALVAQSCLPALTYPSASKML